MEAGDMHVEGRGMAAAASAVGAAFAVAAVAVSMIAPGAVDALRRRIVGPKDPNDPKDPLGDEALTTTSSPSSSPSPRDGDATTTLPKCEHHPAVDAQIDVSHAPCAVAATPPFAPAAENFNDDKSKAEIAATATAIAAAAEPESSPESTLSSNRILRQPVSQAVREKDELMSHLQTGATALESATKDKERARLEVVQLKQSLESMSSSAAKFKCELDAAHANINSLIIEKKILEQRLEEAESRAAAKTAASSTPDIAYLYEANAAQTFVAASLSNQVVSLQRQNQYLHARLAEALEKEKNVEESKVKSKPGASVDGKSNISAVGAAVVSALQYHEAVAGQTSVIATLTQNIMSLKHETENLKQQLATAQSAKTADTVVSPQSSPAATLARDNAESTRLHEAVAGQTSVIASLTQNIMDLKLDADRLKQQLATAQSAKSVDTAMSSRSASTATIARDSAESARLHEAVAGQTCVIASLTQNIMSFKLETERLQQQLATAQSAKAVETAVSPPAASTSMPFVIQNQEIDNLILQCNSSLSKAERHLAKERLDTLLLNAYLSSTAHARVPTSDRDSSMSAVASGICNESKHVGEMQAGLMGMDESDVSKQFTECYEAIAGQSSIIEWLGRAMASAAEPKSKPVTQSEPERNVILKVPDHVQEELGRHAEALAAQVSVTSYLANALRTQAESTVSLLEQSKREWHNQLDTITHANNEIIAEKHRLETELARLTDRIAYADETSVATYGSAAPSEDFVFVQDDQVVSTRSCDSFDVRQDSDGYSAESVPIRSESVDVMSVVVATDVFDPVVPDTFMAASSSAYVVTPVVVGAESAESADIDAVEDGQSL